MGFTDMAVSFREPYQSAIDEQPLTDKIADLERFADNVISRFELRLPW